MASGIRWKLCHLDRGRNRGEDLSGAAASGDVAAFGYEVRPVMVTGCLHLKSAVTAIAEDGTPAATVAPAPAPCSGKRNGWPSPT